MLYIIQIYDIVRIIGWIYSCFLDPNKTILTNCKLSYQDLL